jgi:hypothetical protein
LAFINACTLAQRQLCAFIGLWQTRRVNWSQRIDDDAPQFGGVNFPRVVQIPSFKRLPELGQYPNLELDPLFRRGNNPASLRCLELVDSAPSKPGVMPVT